MTYIKKIISTSSAILISGAIVLSSVSAETESTSSQAPVPTLYIETTTGSTVGTGDVMVGNDRDSHGCIGSAGYIWNTASQKCVRPWEQKEVKKQEDIKKQEIKKQEVKDKVQEKKKQQEVKKEEIKNKIQEKKAALSEKLHSQLTVAIEKLTIDKLTRVLGNIDKAVVKVEASSLNQTKKDNLLAQLEEIRVIIQNKVDTLTGNAPTGNIINDILSGVTSNTTTTDSTAESGTVTNSGTTTVNTSSTGTTNTGTTTTP